MVGGELSRAASALDGVPLFAEGLRAGQSAVASRGGDSVVVLLEIGDSAQRVAHAKAALPLHCGLGRRCGGRRSGRTSVGMRPLVASVRLRAGVFDCR